jgi:hypothetical protein
MSKETEERLAAQEYTELEGLVFIRGILQVEGVDFIAKGGRLTLGPEKTVKKGDVVVFLPIIPYVAAFQARADRDYGPGELLPGAPEVEEENDGAGN